MRMLGRILLRLWDDGIGIRLAVVAIMVMIIEINPVTLTLFNSLDWTEKARSSGDYASAAKSYLIAYQYQPWNTEHLALAAESELRAGHYNTAELYLNQIAGERDLRPQEILWLGSIYAGQGRIDLAVSTWEAGRAGGAIDSQSMTQLAEIYIERQEWGKAAQVLQALTEQAPADAYLFYQLGLIQALDQPELAADALAQAVSLDRNLANRVQNLRANLVNQRDQPLDLRYKQLGVLYLTLDELELAEEALERAVKLNPAYAEALAYLAVVRSLMDKPSLAASQQALALEPNSPVVLYLTGLTWKEHDRPRQARAMFTKAFDIDSTNPAFAVEIASTYRDESALEWAEIWMRDAAYLAGEDIRFEILLVQFYVDEEYLVAEHGLPLAQDLVQKYPDSAEAHDALAWAYFLVGQEDLALDSINRSLVLQPGLARAHFHYAAMLELGGQFDAAVEHYRQASALEPRGKFGALARRALERMGR